MAVASALKVRYEPLRVLAFDDTAATYVGVGPAFSNPIRSLKVSSTCNENLLISFDGITDMDIVPANGYYVWDYCSNKADAVGVLEQSSQERIYVRYETDKPTVGNVYVSTIYASIY